MTQPTTDVPILLVRSGGEASLPQWQAAFAEVDSSVEVRWWTDQSVDPARVHYALVWEPEPGRLAGYPNLQVIFSSAAGVDHITCDPQLPKHLPIVSMGADEVAQTVGEYVCLGALAIMRDLPRFIAAQRDSRWDHAPLSRTARSTRVGIMGMGRIGVAAAAMLRGIGFRVHGWVRTARPTQETRCFVGDGELDAFLAESDIVVGILPDTPQTRGLINARRLAEMPRGAGLVSVGRGSLIVMPDLFAALDSGQLSSAVLDVFVPEPLPPEDPVWRHPRIIVTPHVAGGASIRSRAHTAARGLAEHRSGRTLSNLVDPQRGY